jgi:hypothetical protein
MGVRGSQSDLDMNRATHSAPSSDLKMLDANTLLSIFERIDRP